MKLIKWTALSVVLCLLLGGGVFLWMQEKPIKDEEHEHHHEHAEEHIHLDSDQISALDIPLIHPKPGKLQQFTLCRAKIILHPDKVANILAKVPGIVREVRKNLGDRVQPGEILAILDSPEFGEKKGTYLTALNKEKFAQIYSDKEEELFRRRYTLLEDYLNAKAQKEECRLQTQLAKESLHAFGLSLEEIEAIPLQQADNLHYYPIKSPCEGVIIGRSVTKGDYLESTSQLFQIADLSQVWVELGIYPRDLDKVSKGQFVKVKHPHKQQESLAKIIHLSPVVQDETTIVKAIAQLDNSQGIWQPGSFVQVHLHSTPENVPLCIPLSAVQCIEGKPCVFLRTQEGFEKRVIEIGQKDNQCVQVIQGITEDDQIAGNKTFLLKADLGKESVEHDD